MTTVEPSARVVVSSTAPNRAGSASAVTTGAGRSPARPVGPSMGHGCPAPASAVGPAPWPPPALLTLLLLTLFFVPVGGKICLYKIPELIIHGEEVNP